MLLSQYFVEFIFYSFLGWIWESIYCTIKEKKWADRGFLFGPICPIYGSCVVIAQLVFTKIPWLSNPNLHVGWIFLICMIGSAIAEYGTSLVLETRFHARWWDYSNVPLNIKGRICVPVSTGFGLAGIVVVRYLIPWISSFNALLPEPVYEVLALLFALILGADIALTEASLSTLLRDIENAHNEFNAKAESTYTHVVQAPQIMKTNMVESMSHVKNNVVENVAESYDQMRERFSNTMDKYAIHMTFPEKLTLQSITKFMPYKNRRSGIDYSETAQKMKEKFQRLRDFKKKDM